MIEPALTAALTDLARGSGNLTVMTGAGISSESGIPTFRGPEGYWTVGSRVYRPQEMATYAMFARHPEAVWQWYLFRMDTCRNADPNPGHRAVVEMERCLTGRFTLITQNVDGLHLRAGSAPRTTFQIHGNLFFMRCSQTCTAGVFPLPEGLSGRDKDAPLAPAEKDKLRCPLCGDWARPHVLWFDEVYNEVFYRFESAMTVAEATDRLLVVGTAGATNLPNQVALAVKRKGGTIVDVNIQRNVFSDLALSGGRGFFVQAKSGAALPEMLRVLCGA